MSEVPCKKFGWLNLSRAVHIKSIMNFISLDHRIHSIEDYDQLSALHRTDYAAVYKA